jgi:hypothetical protein
MVAIQIDRPVASFGRFRVSRVLAKSFRALFRNIIWISLIVLAFVLISAGAVVGINKLVAGSYNRETARGLAGIAFLFVFVALYMTTASLVMAGTVQYLHDGRARIGELLARGFARAPVAIFIGLMIFIIEFVLVILALLAPYITSFPPHMAPQVMLLNPLAAWPMLVAALIGLIPGYYLMVIWNVGAAACVAEELGPIRALGRSRRLTKGFRWRIAVLVFISIVLLLLPYAALVFIGIRGAVALLNTWPGYIAQYAISLIIYALMLVIPAATFVELKQAKEGKDIQNIANVFD